MIPTPTATPHAGPTMLPVGPTPQVVLLSGGGYTLSFTVPPVATGSTSTMSAVLQTLLPNGTTAPQFAKRGYAAVRPLSTTFSGMVYLVVSTTASVGFDSAPSFVYTLPAGTTVPSGSNTYLLFWDPYRSGSTGWITLLGPGQVSGQTVTFPSVQTGVQFDADTPYDFALAMTTQVVPTATPAPTPTPTANPSASPAATPLYCAGISTPVPNGNSNPQKVYFTDNSGTGAQVVLYVVSGAPPSPPAGQADQTQYLATNGQMTNFTAGATAPPLPLACFPGSTGGSGLTFELPPPTYPLQSGNLYIALADGTPNPSGTPPNPITFEGGVTPTPSPGATAAPGEGVGNSAPTLDHAASGYVSVPWDEIEYTLPYGQTDTTQVDKVGLPLEVWQGASGQHIGFAEGQLAGLLGAVSADPVYRNLAVSTTLTTTLGTRSVLARILAPKNGDPWGFPQNYFYNSAYYGPNGYIAYLLQQYEKTPQLYTLSGVSVTSQTNYCASSDGYNVLFYSVGSATSCSNLPSTPTYTMPVYETLEGVAPPVTDSYGVCTSAIFSGPYGSQTVPPFVAPVGPNNQDEFYLWKAMAIDLDRGVALQNGTHPIGTWSTSAGAASFSDFTPASSGAFYDKYWYWVHEYTIGNLAYAYAYDEPGGLASTFTSDPSQPLYVTIHNIPPYSAPTPSPAAAEPCPTATP